MHEYQAGSACGAVPTVWPPSGSVCTGQAGRFLQQEGLFVCNLPGCQSQGIAAHHMHCYAFPSSELGSKLINISP